MQVVFTSEKTCFTTCGQEKVYVQWDNSLQHLHETSVNTKLSTKVTMMTLIIMNRCTGLPVHKGYEDHFDDLMSKIISKIDNKHNTTTQEDQKSPMPPLPPQLWTTQQQDDAKQSELANIANVQFSH